MPKTLLLADDSITIQKVVGITFASEDFKVITVDNGEAALRKVKELKPDVILADVVMPRKNGYELCEAVKADAELKAIPVLLLAGTFEAFDENRARAAQADGHIAKPFDSQALIAKVKELLHMPAGAPVAQPQLSPVSTAPIPVPPAAPQRPAVAPRPPAAAPRPMAAPHPGAPGRPPGPFPLGAAPRPGVPPAAMGRPPAGPGVRPPGFVPPGMAPRPPGAPAAPRPGMTGPGVPGQRPGVPGAMPPGARPFTGRVAPPSGARAPSAAPFPPRPTPAVRPPAAPMEPPAARFTPPAPAPVPIVSPTTAPVSLEDTWGELEYDRTAPAAPVFKAPPAVQPTGPTTAVPESTGFTEPSPPAATETPGFPDFGPEEMAKPVELTAANEFVSAAPPAKLKDGGEAQLREALSHASREVIERIAWEVVPQLAETIIREQIDRLAKERQGQ